MANLYEYPNYTQSQDGLLSMFVYVNAVSDGLFFAIMLLAIFMIIFISSIYNTRASRSLAFASFISFMLALPLTILDLLNQKYLYLAGLLLAIGVFWSILDND